MRIVVAMSGGVDSSVAAAILKEEGHEVIGITMHINPRNISNGESDRSGGCCGIDAITDAKKVAHKLGIPHYVVNFRDIFARNVIDDFCQEYSLGRTPNPCIRCNQFIKFGTLVERARELDASMVATGHYARIENGNGRHLLKKSTNPEKDQTYVLYVLTQEQLEYSMFPVGSLTKEEVRNKARRLGLLTSEKPESQEICFIPDNDYARFIEEYTGDPARPGPIIDHLGNVLGKHHGITAYTIGQRKGLGISSREPLYVVEIDASNNTITVGSKGEVYATELIANNLNWISIEGLHSYMKVTAKIRYLHRPAEAIVTPLDENEVQVVFREPQMAITPGQAIVFYDSDTVVGGGTIARLSNKVAS